MSAGSILRRKRWRDLGKRRAQVVAVAVTVFLGVGLYVASYNAYLGLSRSYDATYDRLSFADVWVSGGDTAAVVRDVGAMTGVSAVETRSVADVPVRVAGEHELVARVIGVPDGSTINRLLEVEGIAPTGGGSLTVAVERHGAENFDIHPGASVEVLRDGQWTSLQVTGVVVSAEYLWLTRDRSDVVTNPDDFMVVFAPETFAASLGSAVAPQVLVAVDGHDAAVVDAIVHRAGELGATDAYGRDMQPSNATLQNDVVGFAALSFLFPLLFLGVAGLAASVLLGRMIALQRSEIGMLIANGYAPRTVFVHFSGHALVIALAGGLPGIAAGLFAGNWMTDGYAGFLDIPVVSHSASPTTLVVGLIFVVLTGVIAGGVQAWRAARVVPAEAMRPVAPSGGGRRSLIERMLPASWRTAGAVMVARNLTRNRRRSLSTIVGVVMAAVLILVALSLQDSIDGSIGRQFDELDKRDISVMLDRPATDAVVAELAALPGVTGAEPTASAPAAILAASGERAGVRIDVYRADTRAHDFAGVPLDGLLLHRKTAGELGVRPGDTVRIASAAGLVAEVPVGALHDETFTSLAYLDARTWTAAGGPPLDMVALSIEADADSRALRTALGKRDEVVATVDHRAVRGQVQEMLGLALMFVAIMVIFGIVMAVALIFNAMSVSLAERTSEVATLQANGVSQKWIRRTITVENLLVATLGILPGLVAGHLVSRAFLAQFGADGLSFPLDLTARSYAITVAILLGSAFLAQLPGLRSLGRLDLPTTVRERSA